MPRQVTPLVLSLAILAALWVLLGQFTGDLSSLWTPTGTQQSLKLGVLVFVQGC